jgi:putative transposase
MKFQFMKEHKDLFEVGRMSKVLGVSRSGYYSSLQEHSGNRARENAVLLDYINAAYEESRGTYGSRRIHAVLKAQGLNVGKNCCKVNA